MREITHSRTIFINALAVAAAFVFLYSNVLVKLGIDWWSDENYSHGMLIPFVIALILWKEWPAIRNSADQHGSKRLGGAMCGLAILLLFAGTLGAELFTTRISLAVMLAAIVIYLFGTKILQFLAVPFALLVLAIPIPQIIFNRIAFPLQIWASQMAVWGIRLFDLPTVRSGNVIDILPRGSTQPISLEVVEACSGIRSLMTLVTLALILAYFTRPADHGIGGKISTADVCRTSLLMIAAVPIAALTNAARVTGTGILTYYAGKQATESIWHEVSGWLVYLVALALLVFTNFLLHRLLTSPAPMPADPILTLRTQHSALRTSTVLPLIILLSFAAVSIKWFGTGSEARIVHRPLAEIPGTLGEWRQKGSEIRFDKQVEDVLRATDYTMREYTLADGRIANIYVGYYASQRSGATYHSPQNCLPGAGWTLNDPQLIDISTSDGRTFQANRYIIENGIYREVMIYWYQGRGRTAASEYRDKFNTILDGITRGRTDGAMLRIMTSMGPDQNAAVRSATDLSARLAENLTAFVPE
jgi:exosortase D (VPLPA-CTERM-specific)